MLTEVEPVTVHVSVTVAPGVLGLVPVKLVEMINNVLHTPDGSQGGRHYDTRKDDPDAPDGLAISRIIAAHLAHAWTEILLDETAPAGLGDHPWNTLPPFTLDTSAARRLSTHCAGITRTPISIAFIFRVRHSRARAEAEGGVEVGRAGLGI